MGKSGGATIPAAPESTIMCTVGPDPVALFLLVPSNRVSSTVSSAPHSPRRHDFLVVGGVMTHAECGRLARLARQKCAPRLAVVNSVVRGTSCISLHMVSS